MDKEETLTLGRLYEATGMWDKALALYDEAIEADPTFARAYKARGGVRYHLHDTNGAADDLRQALTLDPTLLGDISGRKSII